MPYIFYVDDSGQVVNDVNVAKVKPFYVLAGVGINVEVVLDLYNEIRSMINQYFNHVEELRASEMFNYKESYRVSLPYDYNDRIKRIDEFVVKILNEMIEKNVHVIISVLNNINYISKSHPLETKQTMQFKTFIHLIERVQLFLNKQNDHGWLIMDIGGQDRELKSAYAGLISKHYALTGSFVKITRILDTIAFADSTTSYGVQIADLISYLYHQWLKHENNYKMVSILRRYPSYLEKWIGMIKNGLIDKCPDGRIEGCGIKIFP